jgi:hypothetical protein
MAWDTLYFMILSYPPKPSPEQREQMRQFWRLFCKHLPCPVCVYHSSRYMQLNPVDTSSRLSLEQYYVEFRNEVNARLKKPVFSLKESRESLYTRRIAQHLVSTEAPAEPKTPASNNTLVVVLIVCLVVSVLANVGLVCSHYVNQA